MTYSKICNFCDMIIYPGYVNGISKWFEDESCTQLHLNHLSSEIKQKLIRNEKLLKVIICKLQYLSEDVQELKKNNDSND